MRLPNETDPAPAAACAIVAEELCEQDYALIEAARATIAKHYRPFWHMVSAAILSRDGRIWTGIHLGATVGRMQICAEPIALGRAILEGDGTIETAVAIRHPKPEEDDKTIAIVSPCGACREMLMDHAPEARVILPGLIAPIKLPIQALMPLPYRR